MRSSTARPGPGIPSPQTSPPAPPSCLSALRALRALRALHPSRAPPLALGTLLPDDTLRALQALQAPRALQTPPSAQPLRPLCPLRPLQPSLALWTPPTPRFWPALQPPTPPSALLGPAADTSTVEGFRSRSTLPPSRPLHTLQRHHYPSRRFRASPPALGRLKAAGRQYSPRKARTGCSGCCAGGRCAGRCCGGRRAVRPPAAAAPAPSLAGAVAPRAPYSAGTRHASSLSRGEQAVQRAKRARSRTFKAGSGHSNFLFLGPVGTLPVTHRLVRSAAPPFLALGVIGEH